MPQQKAGGGLLAKVSRTPAPHSIGVSHSTPETASSRVAASHSRRWTRRPRVTTSDVAAWLLFTLLTAAILLAGCILLAIIWPTP